MARPITTAPSKSLPTSNRPDDIAGALQSTPRGTLRVYTATHIVQFIAPVVAEFLTAYPEVRVDLSIGERTIDLIDEGFDVAVRLTPPPDSSLIVRSLATWRHVLCCSPAYLEKIGPLRAIGRTRGSKLRSPRALSF